MTDADTTAEALLASLRSQRHHVLGILEDLDDDALRRPVLPTGWTCVSMVSHLTYDIERFWFRAVVAGERSVIEDLPQGEEGWVVRADRPAAAVLDAYRGEAALADAVISATALDAEPAWWPEDLFGSFRMDDLREVLLHVIVETACHAGHLDAARELLDGRTWRILT